MIPTEKVLEDKAFYALAAMTDEQIEALVNRFNRVFNRCTPSVGLSFHVKGR